MRIGHARPSRDADIEVVLASSVLEALPTDYRTLGVVAAWLDAHQARVNVPRLGRLLDVVCTEPLARAFWAALAKWLSERDSRWRALVRLYDGPTLALDDPEITALQIKRAGEDPRFKDTCLRVHAKLLRSRPEDVDEPVQVAKRHRGYLRRIQLGSNYRADVWAALETDPEASPADIARRVGCAYETARLVSEDFRVAQSAGKAAVA
jgi:hypothetical protein